MKYFTSDDITFSYFTCDDMTCNDVIVMLSTSNQIIEICGFDVIQRQNIVVFSEKTDVPHLPNQSMVAISVMKV